MPDSISTTYPMGASLSGIMFSFVLEKYIVWDVCGLRSPSLESGSLWDISPTDTSSIQNLILQGLQQKLQKYCSLCNKNTWHVESSYILQPPKYLGRSVGNFISNKLQSRQIQTRTIQTLHICNLLVVSRKDLRLIELAINHDVISASLQLSI